MSAGNLLLAILAIVGCGIGLALPFILLARWFLLSDLDAATREFEQAKERYGIFRDRQ